MLERPSIASMLLHVIASNYEFIRTDETLYTNSLLLFSGEFILFLFESVQLRLISS